MYKESANKGEEVQSQLTELDLHCIAQHYKQWYYSMIGNEKLHYEDAFIKACQTCEKSSICSSTTFIVALKKLSKITGVEISILLKRKKETALEVKIQKQCINKNYFDVNEFIESFSEQIESVLSEINTSLKTS